MHSHPCRRCRGEFICRDVVNCFEETILCDDCLWRRETCKWLFIGLVVIIVVLAFWYGYPVNSN